MAISTCRECGHSVSSEAKACPGCGAVNPAMLKHKSSNTIKMVAIIAGIVILSFFFLCVLGVFIIIKASNNKQSNESGQYNTNIECYLCKGYGGSRCNTCRGSGSIRTKSGFDAVCPKCGGTGDVPCPNCGRTKGTSGIGPNSIR